MSALLPRPVLGLGAMLIVLPLTACGPDVTDLEVGDCLDQADLAGEQVTSVSPTDCAQEHDAEIYAQLELPDGDYPGEDEVRRRTEEHCTAAFEEFIGLPYGQSELFYSYLVPTRNSWEQAEDRTSLCLVVTDEPVTGSLRDAQR